MGIQPTRSDATLRRKAKALRRVRQVDFYLRCHVQSSVNISMFSMPALSALKYRLRLAIRSLLIAAYAASLRGVRRINSKDRHARKTCLLFDLLAQVVERPVRVPRSLAAPNRRPIGNARQVLKGNRSVRVFSALYNLFCNAVVRVALKAALLAAKLLEPTLRAGSANRLQDGAALLVPLTPLIHLRLAILIPVGVRGDVLGTEVDAQDIIHVERIGLLDVTRRQEVAPPRW